MQGYGVRQCLIKTIIIKAPLEELLFFILTHTNIIAKIVFSKGDLYEIFNRRITVSHWFKRRRRW